MEKETNENYSEIGNRTNQSSSETAGGEFPSLQYRTADDPMTLRNKVIACLENNFLKTGTTLLSTQRAALIYTIDHILSAPPGTIAAVPITPGGGKSTLLRALLKVLSHEFTDADSPLTMRLGGAIVVVEKSSEAHELADLCNTAADQRVTTVIESPNNFNLRNGCPNGTATRFEECLRLRCPDYSCCPLIQAAKKTVETPILIMLHARYQMYMEDMSRFLVWQSGEQVFHRSILMVDELPSMFDDCLLSLSTLNEAETELDQLKPSYRAEQRAAKQELLYLWNKEVRTPFFRLSRLLQSRHIRNGLVTETMLTEAGFQQTYLELLQEKLIAYSENTRAETLISALLSERSIYHSTDHTFSLFVPRLKQIDAHSQLSVTIFSGTAMLSPELTNNPDVTVVADAIFEESYARLKIVAQQGDGCSASKTSLANGRNREIVLEWLRSILPSLTKRHRKLLVVTYQRLSEWLWLQLAEYQDSLIPYIDNEGCPTAKLPYFGGMNGSNLYQEATCVISVGLNRFEPREYLNRALALDFSGEIASEMLLAAKEGQVECFHQVLGANSIEHITLARDLVQMVFRSALRKHGEQVPIEFWLLNPPDAVLNHLNSYFRNCQIETLTEMPESCRIRAVISRKYMSKESHAAKLLCWLESNQSQKFTPQDIRRETGLTLNQFKEAKKHPEVQRYFEDYIENKGSGRNTTYWYKMGRPPPVAEPAL